MDGCLPHRHDPSPNGIVVDPEETALLVAVTRANQIWRVPLTRAASSPRSASLRHLHGGPGRPGWLALEVEGCLLIAHEGFGSVWCLSRTTDRSTASYPALRVRR